MDNTPDNELDVEDEFCDDCGEFLEDCICGEEEEEDEKPFSEDDLKDINI